MRKLSLLLAVLTLVLVVLTGCFGKKEEGSTSGEAKQPSTNNSSSTTNTASNKKEEVELDPYVANIPVEIIDAYKEKVPAINKAYKDYQGKMIEENPDTDLSSLGNLKYDLVFFNDDNIPELVVSYPEGSTALYTYDAGEVIYTLKDDEMGIDDERGLGFGVGGNAGYEFIPRANVMRNFNNEYAGLYRWITYRQIDPKTHMLVNKYESSLGEKHFEGDDPAEAMENYVEEPTAYFMGEKEISSGEYASYLVDGDFEELHGTKAYQAMLDKLESMLNIK